MNAFTPDEMEGIVKAMTQKKANLGESAKIPLLPPGSYGKISYVAFSPLLEEKPRPFTDLTDAEKTSLKNLTVTIEVFFGKKRVTLKEIESLSEGSILTLDELCDDLVDIYINDVKIGRGEIVLVDGKFGVKIVSFTKK